MMRNLLQKSLSIASFAASLYCFFGIIASAMLGDTSPEHAWRTRITAWLFFFAAGLLLLLGAFLWRGEQNQGSTSMNRLALFSMRYTVISAILFFLDFLTSILI